MNAYNFSKINQREQKVYSFSDIAISKTGIPVKLIAMAAILLVISIAINIPIGLSIGNWYFAPLLSNGDVNTNGILIVYGIPIGIASCLYYMKISNYRIIDFLIIYLKPKHEISITGNKVIHEKISIDAFLENN